METVFQYYNDFENKQTTLDFNILKFTFLNIPYFVQFYIFKFLKLERERMYHKRDGRRKKW